MSGRKLTPNHPPAYAPSAVLACLQLCRHHQRLPPPLLPLPAPGAQADTYAELSESEMCDRVHASLTRK